MVVEGTGTILSTKQIGGALRPLTNVEPCAHSLPGALCPLTHVEPCAHSAFKHSYHSCCYVIYEYMFHCYRGTTLEAASGLSRARGTCSKWCDRIMKDGASDVSFTDLDIEGGVGFAPAESGQVVGQNNA